MHILLIHQAFVSPNEPGGTRHYELARHLVEQGHQVTIVASDLSYLTGQRTNVHPGLVTEECLDGIRVLRAYTYPALHRSFVWRVVSFFSFVFTSLLAAMRVQNIDLVMGTSPPIFQAVSAWLVAALRLRPLLLEIRDLWPEFAIDMGVLKDPVLIWLSRWLEGFLYARSHHLLVNSPAYRDYLVSKGLPEAKISLIPNGVNPDLFHSNDGSKRIREELGLEGQFVVTYAGALGLANDIPTILRAARRLRDKHDIRFLLVGDGKERTHLEALAKQWDLPNVIFTGARPKSEMPEILAASDACIAILQDIPMFRTTYPNKVFDYMAASRPTVLAIDGVIRQVVEAAGGGIFVPPGDDAALAEAVRHLANNRSKAKAMGIAARTYVIEHFNRRDQAQAFVDLAYRLCQKD
jgi:glycosyltransferase involved in cell wall biosynthesis